MPEVEAQERSSADLRAEICVIDAEIETLDGKIVLFDEKITELALSVYRKDPTAAGRVSQVRGCISKAQDEIRILRDAKAAIGVEVAEAEHREDMERRKVEAAEQERVAQLLDQCADECDAALTAFRVGYMNLVELGRIANPYRTDDFAAAARPGGRESLIRSNLIEAFRWSMHDAGLKWLDIKPPEPLTPLLDGRGMPTGTPPKPTFSRCAHAWAIAARGAAKRLLAPPPVKKPNGHDVAEALKLTGQFYHVDVGESLPGDPPGFRIYDPGNIKG
jgi:hypothetical protein